MAYMMNNKKNMNRLEYIPGDLVTYNGNIVTIENNDGYYATYYDEDESLQEINVNVIKGIPLTPEILEKNGWKKTKINDCAYFYYKNGLFLTYTSKDCKFWFDDFDYSNSICVELPYIHSLQHLLFGIGINHEIEI